MSAVGQGEPSKGADGKKVYRFHQKIPIQVILTFLPFLGLSKLKAIKLALDV